jgi:hypothetical protein
MARADEAVPPILKFPKSNEKGWKVGGKNIRAPGGFVQLQ